MVELSALTHGFTGLSPVFNYGDSELVVMQSIVVVREHVTEATNLKEDGKQSERRCGGGGHTVSDLHFPSKLHFLRIPL